MRFQVCTITTRSYLPQTRVLYRSFRRFHPDIPFHALVFDARPGSVEEPFDVSLMEQIGLPPGEEMLMPMLYNVTELATALKPWFFRTLFSRSNTPLLYFDPDIEIFSPLDQLARLANEHRLVVTPHTTRPISRDDVNPNETDILRAGIYNLGFLGLNAHSGSFLDWWSERLLREAVIDPSNMRFTDQRWMDFAPGYFDTWILKDEACNVAYWNADSRPISWTGDGYEVDGKPLCFFHFSGFRPENPHLLSVHQLRTPRTLLSKHPVVARLCREYAEKLASAGYAELRRLPYGWGEMAGGVEITPEMRRVYREALRQHETSGDPAPPSPFADAHKFVKWLNEPVYPGTHPEITRYFSALHMSRADVRVGFPRVPGPDAGAYYLWLCGSGRRKLQIPDQLFPSSFEWQISKNVSPLEPGINLIGYLRAEAGTGEAGRLMTRAVAATGEKFGTRVSTRASSRQDHPWDDGAIQQPRYDTNLICINADQLPSFAGEVGSDFFSDRHNIGLWFWEAEVFPEDLAYSFRFLHEVWVSSDFVREAVAKASPIPVFTIPFPLDTEKTVRPAHDRAEFDLPNGFLFLFCFDFFSVVERKNPMAVIEAFKQAFTPDGGPILLIKSINGDRNQAEVERLRYACRGRSDIIIRDGYVTAAQRDGLMAECDCYVSLHRSEGFGLTLAEAMLMEKPTIATRYSGNLAFMNDGNSFLCGYELQPVGDKSLPYPPEARWAHPKIAEASKLMQLVYSDREEASRRGRQARIDLLQRHHPQIAGDFISRRLTELRAAKPLPVAFTAIPERPLITSVRSDLGREVDVRRTVPSLLTWILRGPRRAMKEFVRAYDKFQRNRGISIVDTLKNIDVEWQHERHSLTKRLAAQEDELQFVKQELRAAGRHLAELESRLCAYEGETSSDAAMVTDETASASAPAQVPSGVEPVAAPPAGH
ncbi:MAG: glycosyltransferase family 4 protein [Chthoniobacterales bacterium]